MLLYTRPMQSANECGGTLGVTKSQLSVKSGLSPGKLQERESESPKLPFV